MKLEFEQKNYLYYLIMNDIEKIENRINHLKHSIDYFSNENDLNWSEIVEHSKKELSIKLSELQFKRDVLQIINNN